MIGTVTRGLLRSIGRSVEGFGLDEKVACFCVDVGVSDDDDTWIWKALFGLTWVMVV